MTPVSCLLIIEFAYTDYLVAGDIVFFDPDSQTTFVYNLGDMAWVIAATALVWIMCVGAMAAQR